MNNTHASLEELSNRIGSLERRVHALEHPEELLMVKAEPHPGGPPVAAQSGAADLQTATVFPVLGRAMLGIAGAYVLRSVTTAGAAPGLLVSTIAVVYALGWLAFAMRASQALSRYVYAGTSALILAPMLWEITMHFNVLTPIMSAGALVGFATLGTTLEMREVHPRVAWIAHGTTAILATTLAFSTHHVLPFVIAMLIALCGIELARMRGYRESGWLLMALATDAAICGMIFIYSGPQSVRAEYTDLPAMALIMPACLLLVINGSSIAIRVSLHESRVGFFEQLQLGSAFLLAFASTLYFAQANGIRVAGVTCLALVTGLYPATFVWLRRRPDRRDFRVFGTWCAALLIAGTLWAMPRGAAEMFFALAACVAYFLAGRIASRMLGLHGALFLCTSVAISELPQYVFGALAGSQPRKPTMGIVVISMASAVAFFVDQKSGDNTGVRKVLQFLPALVAAIAVSALLAHGVLSLSTVALQPEAHHMAFLRTLTISLVALSLAFVGSRWGWAAMTKLAYVALAFLATKLLFEDLRHGHMAFVAGSIFLFAVTLIAVPRLVRWGARLRAAHPVELAATGTN